MRIERAASGDLGEIMGFIDRHWSKGHVLAIDDKLMHWQHGDPASPQALNWLCARVGDQLVGILGYIPMRVFDPSIPAGKRLVWLALWKTTSDAPAGAGLRLLRALPDFEPLDAIGVLGINPAHPPMYRALGWETGELTQHLAFTGQPRSFSILGAPEGFAPPALNGGAAKLHEWDGEATAPRTTQPAVNAALKSDAYFAARYLQHPRYRYRVMEVLHRGARRGLLATRLAQAQRSQVLRLVDYAGELEAFAEMGSALASLIDDSGAEYADFWESGMPPEVLRHLGMHAVPALFGVMAPNFFEPFLARSGRIEFAIKSRDAVPGMVIVRGDGDQDRPNRLPSR